MTDETPKRRPGRPRKNPVPGVSDVRTAVEPATPVCDCADKLRELEGRIKRIEIKVF